MVQRHPLLRAEMDMRGDISTVLKVINPFYFDFLRAFQHSEVCSNPTSRSVLVIDGNSRGRCNCR